MYLVVSHDHWGLFLVQWVFFGQECHPISNIDALVCRVSFTNALANPCCSIGCISRPESQTRRERCTPNGLGVQSCVMQRPGTRLGWLCGQCGSTTYRKLFLCFFFECSPSRRHSVLGLSFVLRNKNIDWKALDGAVFHSLCQVHAVSMSTKRWHIDTSLGLA